jgi:hypothetical protein
MGRRWRNILRKAGRGPVLLQSGGRSSHVLLSLDAYDRLSAGESGSAAPAAPQSADSRAGRFNVLCRIDAYADYVAVVEADTPEDAAQLAYDEHGDYKWEYHQTAEFDDRRYITLDDHGDEIEGTEIGDF